MRTSKSIALDVFPKEFEHRIWADLDRRFYGILLLSWLVIYSVAITLGRIEYDTEEISARIRQAYLDEFRLQPANLVLNIEEKIPDKILRTKEIPVAGTDNAADRPKTGDDRQISAKEKVDARRQASAQRLANRRLLEDEIGGMGVLGLLSSTGSGGTGDPVFNVLGEAGVGTGDLDGVISEISGMAVVAKKNHMTRLGRPGQGHVIGSADVNDLITGVGSVAATSIGRKGNLEIAFESARISGSGSQSIYRSSDEITRVISAHNDAIEYCYKREKKLNPNIQGSVVLEFVIDYSGRVIDASIFQSTIANKAIEQCVLSRIRGWRFTQIGKNEGNVTVRQKYIFG